MITKARVYVYVYVLCLCLYTVHYINWLGQSHAISKSDEARITKFDIEMLQNEFWKTIYIGVKGQSHESQKHCRCVSLHSC